MNCQHCKANTLDTYLCDSCVKSFRVELARVVEIRDELEVDLLQLSVKSRFKTGAGDFIPPLPFDLDASDALQELADVLHTWIDHYAKTLNLIGVAGLVDELARWIMDILRHIIVHPDAGQCREQIMASISHAWAVIDLPSDSRAEIVDASERLAVAATRCPDVMVSDAQARIIYPCIPPNQISVWVNRGKLFRDECGRVTLGDVALLVKTV